MATSLEASNGPSSSSSSSQVPTKLPSPRSTWLNRAVFLGTGTSGQVPAIHCLSADVIDCEACADAIKPDSRNRRGCCSVALVGGGRKSSRPDSAYEDEQLIVIDAGPTFYGACVDYFRPNKVPRTIAGVLLTHGHADAILGLDNLRAWTMGGVLQNHVDVYVTKETLDVAVSTFPYLADVSKATGGGGVGALRWNIIDPNKPFFIGKGSERIQITPLPVYHGFASRGGPPFNTLGFRIDSMSYVSDCHHIPPSTAKLMAGSDCVVIDSLMPRRHPSHFSTSQAVSLLLSLPQDESRTSGGKNEPSFASAGPSLGILTDITHRIEHHALQQDLDKFCSSLKSWISSTSPSSLATTEQKDTTNGKSRERRGEGSGARWWSEVWDEDKGEMTGRIQVEPSLASKLKNNQSDGTSNRIGGSASGDERHVPALRVAWDGMVIKFLRQPASPQQKSADQSAL
ncbi:hypothetical protein BCV69DRAFT_283524 [Microstroma glucosiphilum]|uniref:Metallo-beta-lactamase domain-containing protein n=1 Tax=Pseudomicrostroma glucosiphilum TaxID=1684307 RepID=A0A316U491_9BASI|nr:hypothetical protein BCV69DRAFT_283524 [Pseudomicrostroma glucosiphilum]PWN20000.1 hypothetical protein BCV69DRAFT_283524 [Pseudomicrostroma glucosiphilum]